MASKHIRRLAASIIIREMQIKTRMRCHNTPILDYLEFRRLILNVDVEELAPLYSVGRKVKWCALGQMFTVTLES